MTMGRRELRHIFANGIQSVLRVREISCRYPPCKCRYEGLALVNVPHNKGVMVFGSGTGAGIQSVKPFDK